MSHDRSTSPVKVMRDGPSHNNTTSPCDNDTTAVSSVIYPSSTSTLSPTKSLHSSAKVAVVSPLFNNNITYNTPPTNRSGYPIKSATSTPFKPSERENTYPIKSINTSLRSNERDNSLLDSSFSSERSPKGKYSPYKLDNSRFNQSNSSLSSNGTQNTSYNERYSLVGYNSSPSTTPVGRNNKAGWYDMHEKHVELAGQMYPSILLCGDSIIAGLARYSQIWNRYFKSRGTLNCGIGGDQTQHVLWRMENMKLPSTVKYAVIHCGTNNIDRDSPQQIANGVISCGLVLQDNNRKLQVVITGLLPRDLEVSHRRFKIKETNKYLKQYCRQFANFVFMRQDSDWVFGNGTLNDRLYYTDYLHLVEAGNSKFAMSITRIIDKLENKEEITYSSDEDQCENKFERKYGERRQDTPKRESFVCESPFKLVRKSNERKRSLSPDNDRERLSTSQKRVRIGNPAVDSQASDDRYPLKQKSVRAEDPSLNNHREKIIPVKHSDTSVADVSRPEYHGDFAITNKLKHEKLKGTVKSIDITLTDKDRLAARKAKFGKSPIGVGSSLKRLSDSAKAEVRGKPEVPVTSTKSVAKIKLGTNVEDY